MENAKSVEKVKIRLQGHEKFPLREGWISKALTIVPDNQDVFLRKDAPDIMGIGNNMVKSLRYWIKAFGLVREGGANGAVLTKMGVVIRKYDPFIELPFTLWLLHSNIARNKEEATTWYMFFNRCDAVDLEKGEIEAVLLREIKKYAPGQNFSEKSLSNDVDVLLNMYSKNNEKYDPEEKNISPFTRLKLVRQSSGKYVKSHPDKKEFSPYIVLYELARMCSGRKGISIEEALNAEGGLGKVYNLTTVMANDYFDRLDALGYIKVDRTAGLDMIYPISVLDPVKVIEEYYRTSGR